jgi:hypothetical protein
MLVFTLLLIAVIGRTVAVIGDASYYFGVANSLQFLYFWDLDINYLAFLFIPLLAYQFAAFNIERKLNWKPDAAIYLMYGALLVLAIEIAQLARAVVNAWPQDLLIYHVIQAVILLIGTALIAAQLRQNKAIVPTQLILVMLPTAIIILNLAIPMLNDVELKATIISQVVLAGACLIPYLGLPERRKQIKRPTPGDFRTL